MMISPFQAIHTRDKGGRILVTAQCGRMHVLWDDKLNPDDNHAAAAQAFIDRWEWQGEWIGGQIKDGSRVFVRITDGRLSGVR